MASDSKTGKRILLGVVVAIIGGGMLLYLIHSGPGNRHRNRCLRYRRQRR